MRSGQSQWLGRMICTVHQSPTLTKTPVSRVQWGLSCGTRVGTCITHGDQCPAGELSLLRGVWKLPLQPVWRVFTRCQEESLGVRNARGPCRYWDSHSWTFPVPICHSLRAPILVNGCRLGSSNRCRVNILTGHRDAFVMG